MTWILRRFVPTRRRFYVVGGWGETAPLAHSVFFFVGCFAAGRLVVFWRLGLTTSSIDYRVSYHSTVSNLGSTRLRMINSIPHIDDRPISDALEMLL